MHSLGLVHGRATHVVWPPRKIGDVRQRGAETKGHGHYGDRGWWTRYCRVLEVVDLAMYSSFHASLWWRSCVIVTVMNGQLAYRFCHFNDFMNSKNPSGVQEQMAV